MTKKHTQFQFEHVWKELKKLTCLLTNLYIKMDKINQKETKNLLFWRKLISVG